jgi:hypothetical protein
MFSSVLHLLEAHFGTLIEWLDGGDVHEYIFAALVGMDMRRGAAKPTARQIN